MIRVRPSATFTTEFGHEFEAERERLLRRRFLWYTGVMWGLGAVVLLIRLIALLVAPERFWRAGELVNVGFGLASLALYAGALVYVQWYRRPRIPLMNLVVWLIVAAGALTLFGRLAEAELSAAASAGVPAVSFGPPAPPVAISFGGVPPPSASAPAEPGDGEEVAGWTIGVNGAAQILATHFFACLFLPWTPRESVRPLVPLLGLNAAITLVYMVLGGAWLIGILTILLSPLIGLPGAGVSWWKHSRLREGFQTRLIVRRYGEMRQELFNARQIHEALFPAPCVDGPCRFSYRYEPMHQIGGDYLYASTWRRAGAEPVVSLVVIDVTGHGISAALTVNRLHGEMERIFAEEPGTPPGEVLRLLNRYVHLTLATHSVYVTALCLRVDPNVDTLEYASGGHPPAFLRAVDGRIDELNSTALVLGAARGEDFSPEPLSLPFGPGDTLVAYTDGAIEARDRAGRMYGTAGLRRLIACGRRDAAGGWPATILGEVEAFRFGPASDDTLVIEVVRPLGGIAARGHVQGAGVGLVQTASGGSPMPRGAVSP